MPAIRRPRFGPCGAGIGGFTFTEGPRWHGGRIWFSDLYTFRVLSAREDGSDLRVEATAFDITDDGDLTNRRVWAEFGPLPTARFAEEAMRQVDVSPDGACLDAEGGLWIADIKGDRLLRVLEGGEVSDEIPTGIGIFACALGGSDGRTLFMCATPNFDVEARKAACDSSIRTVRVTTPAARHYQPPLTPAP